MKKEPVEEKFYARFVAKPKLSKKERREAFWAEEDWDEDDEDEEDEPVEKARRTRHSRTEAPKFPEDGMENRCPAARRCSGCQMANLSYGQTLRWKKSQVTKLLGSYGKVRPVIGMADPFHYRYKVQTAFGYSRGRVVYGVWQSKEGRVAPVDGCLIEEEGAAKIAATVRKLMQSFKLSPWMEGRGGFLRYLLIRRGYATGQVMVVLVAGTPVFPSKGAFVRELLRAHPEITTLLFSVNTGELNLMLGDREEVLYGPGYIEDELCGLNFRISPASFYQVNPLQTQCLYTEALALCELSGEERVLDAYCGVGTIGMIAAGQVKEVIGVETVEAAVKDAEKNAALNGIRNIRFVCADAGEFLTEAAEAGEKPDLVILDPPRAGASKAFIQGLRKAMPEKILYISCNPETQARDLVLLTAGKKYAVEAIQPVDMFPWTHHIETVVLLSKLKVDHHIEIELKMDELDLTAAESKATYDEIKAYVLNKYGLKVSQLYIAQIKRKCGIIERKNYNVSKKEDAKVPQCPPEKEAAIMDALKHFQMI